MNLIGVYWWIKDTLSSMYEVCDNNNVFDIRDTNYLIDTTTNRYVKSKWQLDFWC